MSFGWGMFIGFLMGLVLMGMMAGSGRATEIEKKIYGRKIRERNGIIDSRDMCEALERWRGEIISLSEGAGLWTERDDRIKEQIYLRIIKIL